MGPHSPDWRGRVDVAGTWKDLCLELSTDLRGIFDDLRDAYAEAARQEMYSVGQFF